MIGRSWRFLKILEPMLPTLEDGGLKCNKRLKDCDSTFSVEYDHYEDSNRIGDVVTCCALRAEFRDMQTQTKNAMQFDQWKITNPNSLPPKST